MSRAGEKTQRMHATWVMSEGTVWATQSTGVASLNAESRTSSACPSFGRESLGSARGRCDP